MSKLDPYNPLDLEALGQSLLRQLEQQRVHRLGALKRFAGSGIYALYYCGRREPYAALGRYNRENNCRVPLYVGRAKDSGARHGINPFEPVTGALLWSRVQEHRRTVEQAEGLETDDFAVRVLVVMPIWIPLAEAMAIRQYKPLWNSQLQGFGIHAPGGGRKGQKRSEWDELHPGRSFAGGLRKNPANRAALLERMKSESESAVAAQRGA